VDINTFSCVLHQNSFLFYILSCDEPSGVISKLPVGLLSLQDQIKESSCVSCRGAIGWVTRLWSTDREGASSSLARGNENLRSRGNSSVIPEIGVTPLRVGVLSIYPSATVFPIVCSAPNFLNCYRNFWQYYVYVLLMKAPNSFRKDAIAYFWWNDEERITI